MSPHPHPLVDQDSKNELIMKKQIRQSTSKILQRPSQFQGYDNKSKQQQTNARIKEKLEFALGHKQPPIAARRTKQGSETETGFEKTFRSNFSEDKRLTEYEAEFEALHHESEYESVESKNITLNKQNTRYFGPVSMGHMTKNYLEPKNSAKTTFHSSNTARDTLAKKPHNDSICLGREPDVTPSQNIRLMKRLTNTIDRKIRQITPALPDLEVIKPAQNINNYQTQQKLKEKENVPQRVRKCPDPTLYEDIIEASTEKEGTTHFNQKKTAKSISPEPNPDVRTPFENLQNCLFSFFTAVMPWCMMKKVYWKRDKRSEELYERTARMNAKNRKISKS